MFLYGDAAYALRAWMQVRFPNFTATEEQHLNNALISSVREAVESNYKLTKFFFTSQDMKRKLKCRWSYSSTLHVNHSAGEL